MPRRYKKRGSYEVDVQNGTGTDHSASYERYAGNPDVSPVRLETNFPLDDHNKRIIFSYDKVRLYFCTSPPFFIGDSEHYEKVKIVEHKDFEGQRTLEIGSFKIVLEYGEVIYDRPDLRTFIFNVVSEDRDVKILFPSEAPVENCDRLARILGDILENENNQSIQEHHNVAGNELVEYRTYRPDREVFSNSVRHEIAYLNVADEIRKGLEYGAERASSVMDWVTPVLMSNITPQPDTEVDPTVQAGLKVARFAAEGAAIASEVFGKQVGQLAQCAGRALAPHLQRFGTELLIENYDYTPEQAASTVRNTLEFTSEVAEGIYTIFGGVMNAVKTIGSSVIDNTVKVVKHTYGESAGDAVDDALHTVGNITAARLNSQRGSKKAMGLEAMRRVKPS